MLGLWIFVKGSGKKLFGGDDEPALDGGALQDEIKELGLDATGMEITVDADTVKVSSEGANQEIKEKSSQLRSTLVVECIEDYLSNLASGKKISLSSLKSNL